MKRALSITIIVLLSLTPILNAQQAETFKNPPINHRPSPLWFWNDAEVTKSEIDKQMQAFRDECGYGGLAILPFGKKFKPEYLSEDYFELYEHTVKKAKELGLTLSLYDEYGFPSGSGGAINGDDRPRFKERFPGQTLKRLDKIEIGVKGGVSYSLDIPDKGTLMSVCAMHRQTEELAYLMPNVEDGKLNFTLPKAGNWRLMFFVCVEDSDPNVNYLDAKAVANYVEMTHQSYYNRMGKYFPDVITTSFFDEPTLYRADGRAWTEDFNERFRARFGFGCEDLYPALWYNIGNKTKAARNYFYTLRTELYADGYFKVIDDWNRAHGIKAMGHQDNEEMLNPVGTSGDLMRTFKHLEVPGIDKIGGDRPAEKYYKIISSIAYNWNKSLVMSETYGAMGNLPWEEIYAIAMDQYAKGINVLIPHAVWYDTAKVVFKPELSHRSPIYKEGLKDFNAYLARLNMWLRNDAPYCVNAAILYPIHSLQGDHYFNGPLGFYKGGVEIPFTDYVSVSETLTNELGIDHLFLHPEVLDEKCDVSNRKLALRSGLHPQQLSTLIIPSCATISLSNLEKIKTFYDNGGTVLFTTRLPERGAFFKEDKKISEMMKMLFPQLKQKVHEQSNGAGGRLFFVPNPTAEAIAACMKKAGFTPEVKIPKGSGLRYIHKRYKGRHLYFIANPATVEFKGAVSLPAGKEFETWNPHTGEVLPIAAETNTSDGTHRMEVQLNLPPIHSLFIIEKEN